LNRRFQQALYRAYYDANLRARLIDETANERRAMELLATTRGGTVVPALSAAEAALAVDPGARAGAALRARVFELITQEYPVAHRLVPPRRSAVRQLDCPAQQSCG
jgi:hypothetical protein